MKSIIFSVLVLGFVSTGAFAASSNTSTTNTQNSNQHMYGNSHNNYRGTGGDYGASHHNYNGKETYGAPPKFTNHPADYSTSQQALDTSVPY